MPSLPPPAGTQPPTALQQHCHAQNCQLGSVASRELTEMASATATGPQRPVLVKNKTSKSAVY